MQVSYEKLQGLDRDRVISVVEPVLRAHRVDAVELVWQSDSKGWVLYLTVERPGSTAPGAGVTLDLCAEISRDLSAALDVAEAISGRYRLEVGSPGVERTLYGPRDFARFSGHAAKLKLREPLDGRAVVRGTLRGLDESGSILLDTEEGEMRIEPERVRTGQLVFEWQRPGGNTAQTGKRRGRSGRAR